MTATLGRVVNVDESAAPTDVTPPASDVPVTLKQRLFRRPKHPWLAAAGVIVVVLLLLELYARAIENQFETLRAGDSSEMILKAERLQTMNGQHIGAVFFGNSMMDTAVSPAFFTKNSKAYPTAYNAAVVGAPLQTRLRWGKEVVLRDLDPDVIVVGVHPVDLLHTDFLKLNQDPQQADVIFSKVLRETDTSALGSLDRSLNANLAVVRNRGVLRKPRTVWDATLRQLRGQPKPKEFDVRTEEEWQQMLKNDGEISLFHGVAFKEESIKNTGPKLKENLQTKNFSTAELTSLLDALEDTGIRVVVVVPPVPLDAWAKAGVDLDALHRGNELIQREATARGMRVVDFTDRGYKNAWFGDVLHANEKGSVQFSKELAEELDKPA